MEKNKLSKHIEDNLLKNSKVPTPKKKGLSKKVLIELLILIIIVISVALITLYNLYIKR